MSDNSSEPTNLKKRVFVKTFGCQMNEYDTEKMLALISDSYQRVDTAEEADLAIVNTCSVREKGEHKLFGLLGRLRDIKKNNPDYVIGVGGCVAQQEGQNIITRNSAVDFVVGTHNLSYVPALIKSSIETRTKQVAIDYRDEWEELPDQFNAMPSDQNIVSSTFNTNVRALVAIQRGCNKKCAFCVVPTTRGPQVSRLEEEILKEVRLKTRMGAREVMLLGQTVNSYGVDLVDRKKFSNLIRRIAEIENVERIRFTSPHPAEIKKDFIDLYKEVPQLCPHVHMPLQSGSNRILKAMNRNYRRERFLEVVNDIKMARPDVAISTDIIVGFPTETQSDFEDTLEIMNLLKFHSSFSYKYSIRPNTKANLNYLDSDEVEESVKTERLMKIQALQQEHSLEFNTRFLGQKVAILGESNLSELNVVKGRTEHNIFAEIVIDETIDKNGDGKLIEGRVARATPHGIKMISESAYQNSILN